MGHSSETEAAAPAAPGAALGGRYRVEGELGVGGMGAVYRVYDSRRARTLALKQLRAPNGPHKELLTSQFEREYHTLSQLAHPSIIEVYEYGIDEAGNPFYTMELLDGEDLRERPRPTWREACALLRDVASSLAIMHARRLLHRDISARNIRCTTDGRAKLIDFGAMAPMGVLKHIVGTPPFVPPEALHLQPVDGRADLYALGGVLYWLLTRRHAFPARSFSELPDLWRTPLASPRQYDENVPVALDQLIMQLLQFDRSARPASAAEVIERLSGVAGLPVQELPEVARAYLALPTLVGREAPAQHVRLQLLQARRGEGSSVVIEGPQGGGRSRMLDACVLESKLLGAEVLRGEAADGAAGPYGLVRALADQLFSALPVLAMRAASLHKDVLAHVLPQLRQEQEEAARPSAPPLESKPSKLVAEARSIAPVYLTAMPSGLGLSVPVPSVPPGDGSRDPGAAQVHAGPERRELQAALRDFIAAVAQKRHLVIAIDDCDAVDEPSAALLAALAHVAKRRKLTLLLVVRPETQGAPPAIDLLRRSSHVIQLAPLRPEQTEALLRSVFSDVPNLAAVATAVHGLAQGSPRKTMELAEHLVGRGVARYEAGSWALPAVLGPQDIPATATAALSARIAQLPPEARALGQALALTDPTLIPVEAYAELTDDGDRARTFRALSSLVSGAVLVAAADRHRFGQHEYGELLRAELSPEHAKRLHGRIARVLERGNHPFQLVDHLLAAGREREAVERCWALCQDPRTEYSDRWLALLERASQAAEALRLPCYIRAAMQARLLFLCALLGDYEGFKRMLPAIRDRVMRESGLGEYYELGEITDPAARAAEAIRRAEARYAATSPEDRGFSPAEACTALGAVWGGTTLMAAIVQDLSLVEHLPKAAPLSACAPGLVQLDDSVEGQCAIQAGRFHIATRNALRTLAYLESPESQSMTEDHRNHARSGFMYQLGLFSAVIGNPRTLTYMEALDQPQHRSNAWRVKMVYELMLGRQQAAADCQRRAELLGLQDSGAVALPGSTARIELLAAIYGDDVIGVKRMMERIESLSARYPGWRSTLELARCHYRRLQGDLAAALEAARAAVELAPAARHYDWGVAVTAELQALTSLGRAEEAVERGLAYLATAEREELGSARQLLTRVLAEACARSGRLAEALSMADQHLAGHVAIGTRGLQLAMAYETRARVAIAMHDEPSIRHYAELCAQEYKGSRSVALSVKYHGLMREAEAAGVAVSTTMQHAADVSTQSAESVTAHTLQSRLLTAVGSAEGADRALRFLLESHDAVAGYLFSACERRLDLLAAHPAGPPSDTLIRTLELHLATLPLQDLAAAAGADDSDRAVPDDGGTDLDEATSIDASGAALDDATTFDEPVAAAGEDDDFEPLLLFAKREGTRRLVAVAALRFQGRNRSAVPARTLEAFANALIEHGLCQMPEEVASGE